MSLPSANWANQKITYHKFGIDGDIQPETTLVPVEQRTHLMVNGEDWLSFMCTPLQLEALGIGFLFNESIIEHIDQVSSCRVCENYTIDIWLKHSAKRPDKWTRTSGCSGGKSAKLPEKEVMKVESSAKLSSERIRAGVKQLTAAQELYRQSRGVHCSALSDGNNIRFVAEDIGRHNTFDKLTGLHLQSGETMPPLVLLTTGRVSSEMMQKASRLGTAFVISLTSPTLLSIQIAETAGITLIGYARNNSFNVYSHKERIFHTAEALPNVVISPGSSQDVGQF